MVKRIGEVDVMMSVRVTVHDDGTISAFGLQGNIDEWRKNGNAANEFSYIASAVCSFVDRLAEPRTFGAVIEANNVRYVLIDDDELPWKRLGPAGPDWVPDWSSWTDVAKRGNIKILFDGEVTS